MIVDVTFIPDYRFWVRCDCCPASFGVDSLSLVDVANPAWRFVGEHALCPMCSLRLAQAARHHWRGKLLKVARQMGAVLFALGAWQEERERRAARAGAAEPEAMRAA